jgi:acid phosphatase family membrane protein YuiD
MRRTLAHSTVVAAAAAGLLVTAVVEADLATRAGAQLPTVRALAATGGCPASWSATRARLSLERT